MCVRERDRDRESVCLCVYVCVGARESVCVCLHACMYGWLSFCIYLFVLVAVCVLCCYVRHNCTALKCMFLRIYYCSDDRH